MEFDIKNTDRHLNGGEYIQAEVCFRRSTPSLWVPATSVVNATAGMFVLNVQNDTIRTITVKQGVRKDGLTEVYGDLQEKDVVVVNATEELRQGTKVITK